MAKFSLNEVTHGPAKAPDLGNMTDQEFAAYKRTLGIG